MYFNHFVKVAVYQVINGDYLWRMILRGAAILCTNIKPVYILSFPFATLMGRVNVSDMFWQIKNDARFGGLGCNGSIQAGHI